MRIEVTEKEAMEIYSQRYTRQQRKRSLPLFSFSAVVTLVAFYFISTYINAWLGLVAIVLIIPSIYVSLRLARASCKYAQNQIKEPR